MRFYPKTSRLRVSHTWIVQQRSHFLALTQQSAAAGLPLR